MGKGLPRKQLVGVAEKWGRKPHAVRSAVDQGLLYPSKIVGGGGKGSPPKRMYHDRADIELRTLFRLQDLGLRGDALRLALWWVGQYSFDSKTRNFMLSVFRQLKKNFVPELRRMMKSLGTDNVGSIKPRDLFATMVENKYSKFSNIAAQFLSGLDRDAKEDPELIELIVKGYLGSLYEFTPFELGTYQSEKQTQGGLISRYLSGGTSDRAFTPQTFADIEWLFESGNMYPFLVGVIKQTKSEAIDAARDFVKGDEENLEFKRTICSWLSQIQTSMSDRAKNRQGNLRHTYIVARVLLVTYVIGLVAIIKYGPKKYVVE